MNAEAKKNAIIVALIGAFGLIAPAVVSGVFQNWDKIFPTSHEPRIGEERPINEFANSAAPSPDSNDQNLSRPETSNALSSVVVEGIPVEQLLNYRRSLNGIEARRLIQPYEGSEVTVTGNFHSIIGYRNGGGIVHFSNRGEHYPDIRLSVATGFDNYLAALDQGASFSAKCLFTGSIDEIGITLEECQPIVE